MQWCCWHNLATSGNPVAGDEFVCQSSPAVEQAVRSLAKDIEVPKRWTRQLFVNEVKYSVRSSETYRALGLSELAVCQVWLTVYLPLYIDTSEIAAGKLSLHTVSRARCASSHYRHIPLSSNFWVVSAFVCQSFVRRLVL